jgi:hypothetical protein
MFRDDDGRSSRANLEASVHTPVYATVASPRYSHTPPKATSAFAHAYALDYERNDIE